MNYFGLLGIHVELADSGFTVMVRPGFPDRDLDGVSIVYADPIKLKRYVDGEVSPVSLRERKKAEHNAEAAIQAAKIEVGAQNLWIVPGSGSLDGIGSKIRTEFKMVRAGIFGRRQMEVKSIVFTDGPVLTARLIAAGATFVPLAVSTDEAEALHALVGGTKPIDRAKDFEVPSSVGPAIIDASSRGAITPDFVSYLIGKQSTFEQLRKGIKQLAAAYDYLVNYQSDVSNCTFNSDYFFTTRFGSFEDRLNANRTITERGEQVGIAYIGLYHHIFLDIEARLRAIETSIGRDVDVRWKAGSQLVASVSGAFFQKFADDIQIERLSPIGRIDQDVVDRTLTDREGKKTDWYRAGVPPKKKPAADFGGRDFAGPSALSYEDELRKMEEREREMIEANKRGEKSRYHQIFAIDLPTSQSLIEGMLRDLEIRGSVDERSKARQRNQSRDRGGYGL